MLQKLIILIVILIFNPAQNIHLNSYLFSNQSVSFSIIRINKFLIMLFQKSLLSLITMFDCNSYPIQKCASMDAIFSLSHLYYKISKPKESSQNLEIKIEEHKQNDNTSLQYQYNNDTINFDPYMFPGQSKITIRLQEISQHHLQQNILIKQKQQKTKQQKSSQKQKSKRAKKHMILLMKSKIARQIVKIYFGNYLWCSSILEQMKSDIQFYLCLNKQIFRRKSKQKKTLNRYNSKNKIEYFKFISSIFQSIMVVPKNFPQILILQLILFSNINRHYNENNLKTLPQSHQEFDKLNRLQKEHLDIVFIIYSKQQMIKVKQNNELQEIILRQLDQHISYINLVQRKYYLIHKMNWLSHQNTLFILIIRHLILYYFFNLHEKVNAKDQIIMKQRARIIKH